MARPRAMIVATMPSMRSIDFFFEGLRFPAASISKATLLVIGHVAGHPAQHGMPATPELAAKNELLYLLRPRQHVANALTEGDHPEAVAGEVRRQVRGVPAVPILLPPLPRGDRGGVLLRVLLPPLPRGTEGGLSPTPPFKNRVKPY